MASPVTRRRVIAITAAAAGLGLLPLRGRAAAQAEVVTWHGQAMGAIASMRLHHHDREAAERLIDASIAEVRRLEGIFSLYQDSALVRLNRTGMLVAPPSDLVELLHASVVYRNLTDGAFDPTVQPLWVLYRSHFSRSDAPADGPMASTIKTALANVGMEKMVFDSDRIVLRRGMAITMNGIAQGYATDQVVRILRAGGIRSSLVDMGEVRTTGQAPDGRPWQVGIANPDNPDVVTESLEVVDCAVATSAGYGFRFDPAGRFSHLLDPRTGMTAARYRSMSVKATTATEADALSTAFSLNSPEQVRRTMQRRSHLSAVAFENGGERLTFGS